MSFPERRDRAAEAIRNADAVLIGAGAGFSAAAGLTYGGARFEKNFPDFIARFGLRDMYSTMFYPFPRREQWWAYASRHILINRYDYEVGAPYRDLFALIADKTHFVLTTNVDMHFFRAGFDPAKVFATQGDYGKFQCQTACHDTLYDNEAAVRAMAAQQEDLAIPSALVPVCPNCGGPMFPHIRIDAHFIENGEWEAAAARYQRFVEANAGGKLVLIELGVGYNTPGIIKYPFEELAAQVDGATLIRLNRDHPNMDERNREKTITFTESLPELLASWRG